MAEIKIQNPILKIAECRVNDFLAQNVINNANKGTTAVFFDIDGTLSRNDNLELLMAQISRMDLLPPDKKDIFEKQHRLWKCRELDFENYLQLIIKLLSCLKGFPEEIFSNAVKEIWEHSGAYYFVFPWLLLMRLKCLGYKLIAISGAPSFMAGDYLKKIGIFADEVNCSDYHFEGNIFTGDINLDIIKNKGDFIEKKYGKIFNFKECFAIGDTPNDCTMLEKVGKPLVFNPTLELAKIADKRNWPIIIERKNLIISIKGGKAEF